MASYSGVNVTSILRKTFSWLTKNLAIKCILSELFSSYLIDLDLLRELEACHSSEAANKKFCTHLFERATPENFDTFIDILRESYPDCPKHKDVVEKLEAELGAGIYDLWCTLYI